jgi:hypothetical protein
MRPARSPLTSTQEHIERAWIITWSPRDRDLHDFNARQGTAGGKRHASLQAPLWRVMALAVVSHDQFVAEPDHAGTTALMFVGVTSTMENGSTAKVQRPRSLTTAGR